MRTILIRTNSQHTPRENMQPTDPKDCPYYLITRASLAMTSMLKRGFAIANIGGVKPAYLGVLWCLLREEGVKMNELGRCAGLEPSTMTGLLDRMERDNLVERRPDPTDRRAQLIWLTDQGKDAKDTIITVVNDTLDTALRGISEEDLEQSKSVLRKVLTNATEGKQS